MKIAGGKSSAAQCQVSLGHVHNTEHARIQKWTVGRDLPPSELHVAIVFLKNTGTDPLNSKEL